MLPLLFLDIPSRPAFNMILEIQTPTTPSVSFAATIKQTQAHPFAFAFLHCFDADIVPSRLLGPRRAALSLRRLAF